MRGRLDCQRCSRELSAVRLARQLACDKLCGQPLAGRKKNDYPSALAAKSVPEKCK